MGFIETLNKYSKRMPINKSKIYQQYLEEKEELEKKGFAIRLKNELDLFDFEITLKSFISKNKIDDAYEIFVANHYDMLAYINYEEKRKIFNEDLQPLLDKLPSFHDQKSATDIYIAFFEPFINERYTTDYQILTLKQHNEYVKNYKAYVQSGRELYGNDIYKTDFSSLILVYEDERHVDYYSEEFQTIYIFKEKGLELLNTVMVRDAKSEYVPTLEEITKIIQLIEEYKYSEVLSYMYDLHCISDKTYKKVLKKYK